MMTTEQLRQKELSVIEHFKNAASDGCVCDVCNAVRDYTTTQSLLREDEARVFKENNIKLYGELEKAEQDAAAQLAEKERELTESYEFREVEIQLRMAAEQRLQEAQDRAECDAADWSDTHTGAEIEIADLRERLRQREAELDELREHCVSEHECSFCQLPTREDAGRE